MPKKVIANMDPISNFLSTPDEEDGTAKEAPSLKVTEAEPKHVSEKAKTSAKRPAERAPTPVIPDISAEDENVEGTQDAELSPMVAGIQKTVKPVFIENRSRRIQLVMQPSLYEIIKKTADSKHMTFNDLVHQVLDHTFRG